jgi:uncharacterized protein Smg (DUF494 family)
MLPLNHSAPPADDHKRRDVYILLREVYTIEQLEMIAHAALHLKQLAIERRCQQELTVIFNEKGFPRVIKRVESNFFVKPLAEPT